jgi:hypothetical protein
MTMIFYKAEYDIAPEDKFDIHGYVEQDTPTDESVAAEVATLYTTATNILHWHIVGTNCSCGEYL